MQSQWDSKHINALPVSQTEYLNQMARLMWNYRISRFAEHDDYFDRDRTHMPPISFRPPVFEQYHAIHNILRPDVDDSPGKEGLGIRVATEIPDPKRHRWFGSMKSSQALAQSVFGNLKHLGKLSLLADLTRDDREPLFPTDGTCCLEQEIGPFRPDAQRIRRNLLGEFEHRGTSVDVLFEGGRYRSKRVAVECKFTEPEIGRCSKYGVEAGCYLTNHAVRYWTFWPALFRWSPDQLTCDTCPAYSIYQLARNILAACVNDTGEIHPEDGHAVLIYDERNPSFQAGGIGDVSWQEAKSALIYPELLQRCTWQEITGRISRDSELKWLVEELAAKYGFCDGSLTSGSM